MDQSKLHNLILMWKSKLNVMEKQTFAYMNENECGWASGRQDQLQDCIKELEEIMVKGTPKSSQSCQTCEPKTELELLYEGDDGQGIIDKLVRMFKDTNEK